MLSFNKILRKKEFATKMTFYNWTWWSESSGYDRDVNEVSSPTVDWHLLVDRNVIESGFNVIWRSCFNAGTLRNTVPWMPKYSSTLNCWNLNWTNSMLIWTQSPIICVKSPLICNRNFAFFSYLFAPKIGEVWPKKWLRFFWSKSRKIWFTRIQFDSKKNLK